MKRLILMLSAMLCMAMLTGCVSMSDRMTKSTGSSPQSQDKATVVFMRPSRYGGAIQASVYDIRGSNNTFIGIVSGTTKIAYQADPGEHLFMVIGENADFMNATLVVGKTYYVLVSPRIGMWKARFSLLPIHNGASAKYSLQSANFVEWQKDTNYVSKSATADAWYSEHAAEIASKQNDYMQKWNKASAQQKAELTLHAGDGM